MGAGIGFVRDGQSSYRSNRDLRKKHAAFQKQKDNPFIHPPKILFKDPNSTEHQKFRIKFRKQARREQNIRLLVLFGTIVIVSFIALFFFF